MILFISGRFFFEKKLGLSVIRFCNFLDAFPDRDFSRIWGRIQMTWRVYVEVCRAESHISPGAEVVSAFEKTMLKNGEKWQKSGKTSKRGKNWEKWQNQENEQSKRVAKNKIYSEKRRNKMAEGEDKTNHQKIEEMSDRKWNRKIEKWMEINMKKLKKNW